MAPTVPAEGEKRGRGRPRKPDSEKKAKPPSGRPRGRPKGSKNKATIDGGVKKTTASAPATPAATGTRRGRGRPRKSDVATNDDVAAETPKATPAKTPGTGRGRGRPRKSDVSVAAAATTPASTGRKTAASRKAAADQESLSIAGDGKHEDGGDSESDEESESENDNS